MFSSMSARPGWTSGIVKRRTVIPYISTTDLSAYLDGELDEDRRVAIEGVLAENPEMADRLSEYQRRDAALRRAFNEFLASEKPDA